MTELADYMYIEVRVICMEH